MQKLFGSVLSSIYKMKDETSPMYIPTHTHVLTTTIELPWLNWSFNIFAHENQLDDQL